VSFREDQPTSALSNHIKALDFQSQFGDADVARFRPSGFAASPRFSCQSIGNRNIDREKSTILNTPDLANIIV
jgi:hypothetical protein